VPSSFCQGINCVYLKNSPNQPENYSPITISTVFSKLFEFILIFQANISESHFGFWKGQGTYSGCRFMSDII